MRTLALVSRNLQPRHYMYPFMLSVFIPLKILNPSLYRRFIQGDCRASAILNYFEKQFSPLFETSRHKNILNIVECQLYRAEMQ